MLILEILEGHGRGRVLELELGEPAATIGRSESSTLAIPDARVSSAHGELIARGEQFVYRDLRSTNGTYVLRGGDVLPVDATRAWQIELCDGDRLRFGSGRAPVHVSVSFAQDASRRPREQVIASRSIVDLPAVTHRVEGDPVSAMRVYKALSPLSARVDMSSTLEAVVDAALQLLPGATNVSILLRSDADSDRFTVAIARERIAASGAFSGGLSADSGAAPVRASRAVLRRVLADRAAVLTMDAQAEMAMSESILGGHIRSVLAVPLWRGDEITGLIQIDNRASPGGFDERDLEVALLLGGQAALAVDNASLVSRLRVAEERLRGEVHYLKQREERLRCDDIIGESRAMRAVFAQLEKVVDTRATICIQGETGTGKELVASALHYQSSRRDKMFVAQNCATLPANLLETELFGHKKGAFTGADRDKKGLIELADQGTLFLDEIGEMPLALQAKLLRFLQEGTIRPVGGDREKQVDIRVVCATHRNLEEEVANKTFRQDLYYRLMVVPIRLPPLRERLEDIPLLAEHFLRRYARDFGREVAGLAQEALDALAAYEWPGNIRELENEMQRLVIQVESGAWVKASDLSDRLRRGQDLRARLAPKPGTLKEIVEQVERTLILEALSEHDGNKTRAAEKLGMTREGLHKKIVRFGL